MIETEVRPEVVPQSDLYEFQQRVRKFVGKTSSKYPQLIGARDYSIEIEGEPKVVRVVAGKNDFISIRVRNEKIDPGTQGYGYDEIQCYKRDGSDQLDVAYGDGIVLDPLVSGMKGDPHPRGVDLSNPSAHLWMSEDMSGQTNKELHKMFAVMDALEAEKKQNRVKHYLSRRRIR